MGVSIPQTVDVPAKDTIAKPEPSKPHTHGSRRGGGQGVAAKETRKTSTNRSGTKTAKILRLLRRPHGASLRELTKATDWQPHSVRGFLSGTVKGKMRLKIASVKRDDGERAYYLSST